MSLTIPANPGAERAVLAACMARQQALFEIIDIVSPGDFYDAACRAIATTLWEMAADGSPIEPIAVWQRLKATKRDVEVGAFSDMMDIVTGLPDVANVRWYADKILESSKKRSLWKISQRLAANAIASDMGSETVIDDTVRSIIELTERNTKKNVAIGDQADIEVREIRDIVARGGLRNGIKSGMHRLDYATNGWQDGDFIVLAARPSVGKTALALGWALFAARQYPVLFISLEMPAQALTQRALAMFSNIGLGRIRRAALAPTEIDALKEASERLKKCRLHVAYMPAATLSQVLSTARSHQIQHGLRLIVIDYLQIMASGQRHENRVSEVTAISGGCKALAGRLGVPVIVLSQLSRPEKLAKPRPHDLSDLRDSGAIEQDADVVMFLQRSTSEGAEALAVLRIAKQRQGPCDDIPLIFDGERTAFREDRPSA